MVLPTQTHPTSVLDALRDAKEKASSHISAISLKNVCYGASIVFSMMCVIHARKGKIITAATLAVLTEVAMFFASTKKKGEPRQATPQSLANRVSYTPKTEKEVGIPSSQNPISTGEESVDPIPDKLTTKEFIGLLFLSIISMR